MDIPLAVHSSVHVSWHATTGPREPFMAATAGPPGLFAALQMVPRIIQRLLLFIEPYSNVKN